ncbi:deoxyguanosinetriphosphate triphosphohydrolase [Beggiatoa leptomitoformis]|uniref:Deoxyguanosinetriphosphate triphosphohydrolase-like protein n=1 Tax=Beggiatoa leptomitoformis TaxID=288004 RepID=A0A2N9YDB2_9GAMM|nr:deoxyguanosinetriphosphate triphosphohydrolase [Beggiatoa leptomitoformis]ALG69137.1 deoxyguanosinetriphosphate triphosphohydrolase [Beggiatoa leptomitoformis]AUI68446.1 deoxyguanosinetriphosphate triphosphohydrolase [Beggiatoa leptomitoformis]
MIFYKGSLARYAAHESLSLGRQHLESPSQYRTDYQRDRDRIIHSAAFRRLEYKTQVFVNHEGDLFRTRLTHSLEVAQLSRTVARSLSLNEDLTEAIALAHDIGHTPFGHAGQDALHQCMKEFGGFEHNLQALRIVDELEDHYPAFRGLNLTFEVREGILKHCSSKQAKLLGRVASRFLYEPRTQPSLEAQIANLCDEIAYNNHDIDDALRAKLVSIQQLREQRLFNDHYTDVMMQWSILPQRRIIHETIRRMIGEQIANLIETSSTQLETLQPKSIDDVRAKEESMLTLSAAMYEKHLELKQFLRTQMYQHYRVQRMAFKARRVINGLFEAFNNDARLLPTETQTEVKRLQELLGNDSGRARATADYIAGMTDRYAIAEYERLYNPLELP